VDAATGSGAGSSWRWCAPSDLPDQLVAERASLGTFQASLALARTNFERASSLAPKGLVSQQELQQATTRWPRRRPPRPPPRRASRPWPHRLGETRILPRWNGVVLARRLDPGALVGPRRAARLLTVAQTHCCG
jgi:multidrug resistance efflux pump